LAAASVRRNAILHRLARESYRPASLVTILVTGISAAVRWRTKLKESTDFTFVAANREQIFREDGLRGAGPDAVVEVRSPYDETHENFRTPHRNLICL
jgi:hypothetical protein